MRVQEINYVSLSMLVYTGQGGGTGCNPLSKVRRKPCSGGRNSPTKEGDVEMKEMAEQKQGEDENDEDSFGGVYLGPPGWLENINNERGNTGLEASDNAVGNAEPQSGKDAENVCDQAPGIECMIKKYEEEGGNLEVTCNVSGGTNAMSGKINVIVDVHAERG